MVITTEQDIMARTLYGEVRGEGTVGMQAVANVILNRMLLADRHPHFGNGDAISACQAPWQFSCWNENDPNRKIITAVTNNDPTFSQCLWVASDALNGLLTDQTGGATYYKVIGTPALWADGQTPCAVIGHHEFYKNIA